MKKVLRAWVLAVPLVLLCCVALLIAEIGLTRDVPGLFRLDEDVQVKIYNVSFVRDYDGILRRFRASRPDRFRGAVVTLEISKPAGKRIALHVADLSLHYYRDQAEDYDVAPCDGLSTFSVAPDVDRPMQFARWLRQSTGASTTRASVVYIDAFFQNMEPGTNDMWLCIAQPATPRYTSTGWRAGAD